MTESPAPTLRMRPAWSTVNRPIAYAVAVVISGCELWDDRVVGFETARFYELALFESEAACAAAQAYVLNCTQSMLLCPAGGGYIVFDDIVMPLRYAVLGSTISVRPEFSSRLTFSLSEDRTKLVDLSSHATWERKPEREPMEQAANCR